MDVFEVIKNFRLPSRSVGGGVTDVDFWPYRRTLIALFRNRDISREEFVQRWGAAYGKGV